MTNEMQMIDLAILLGLPKSGPARISEHINRLRLHPVVERRLSAFFHLSIRQIRHNLWPQIYRAPRISSASPSRVRARAHASFNKQESKS